MFQYTPYVTKQVSVAATPTLLLAENKSRSGLLLINHGTTDVFVGDVNVSITTGILLTGAKGAAIAFDTTAPLYGIVAAATQTISVLETQ